MRLCWLDGFQEWRRRHLAGEGRDRWQYRHRPVRPHSPARQLEHPHQKGWLPRHGRSPFPTHLGNLWVGAVQLNRLNPNLTQVRLGLKRAFEIFPVGLVKRIKQDRKVQFDEEHRGAMTEAQRR